ncbi:TPA: hypothetical protein PP061_001613 [Salmonella bongori]|uniref:Uncharacterized protein n=1 Tax=Salmonella bongori N268-08 TaxID=1197719 RepID=S5MQI4_SALBN|nr:hypothetical protein [Salmonella bongori]AGR58991.1 hypothetical protein A464_1806 [Salmonella bongori N268-08]HDJ2745656.1 hypothetical protein [Salmonella bongori]HDJ2756576.1 hypothetical protein [Salmonella bongori]HDJ2763755.1 hypothetical protein [Salmonella bongori]
MIITSEQEHVVTARTQPRDVEKDSDTKVFRPVPQNWKLTPSQRAFIDALADDESQK